MRATDLYPEWKNRRGVTLPRDLDEKARVMLELIRGNEATFVEDGVAYRIVPRDLVCKH